ncbi:MAG TPA: hypothetical protein VFM71_09080 [Gemmatimonadaceae bacterium]|nr:hypothetical protein [Gemmatimonadaceae bacterium]
MSSHSTGYYGSALSLNLDVPEGARLFVWDGPADYVDWITPLPPRARIIRGLDSDTDLVHVFVRSRVALERSLRTLQATLRPDAAVWVSWPKRASRVRTDVREELVRAAGEAAGFIETKVCSIDEMWWAMKFVARNHQH